MSHSFPTLRSSYLLTVNEFTHHASRSYWSTSSQGPPLPWLITPAWLDCVGVVQPSTVQRLEMFMPARSEERRVGNTCVSPCRSRWAPDQSQEKENRIISATQLTM